MNTRLPLLDTDEIERSAADMTVAAGRTIVRAYKDRCRNIIIRGVYGYNGLASPDTDMNTPLLKCIGNPSSAAGVQFEWVAPAYLYEQIEPLIFRKVNQALIDEGHDLGPQAWNIFVKQAVNGWVDALNLDVLTEWVGPTISDASADRKVHVAVEKLPTVGRLVQEMITHLDDALIRLHKRWTNNIIPVAGVMEEQIASTVVHRNPIGRAGQA